MLFKHRSKILPVLLAGMIYLCTSCQSGAETPIEYTVISDGTIANEIGTDPIGTNEIDADSIGSENSQSISSENIGSGQVAENSSLSDGKDPHSEVSSEKLTIPDHMETRYISLSFDERMRGAYNEVVSTMTNFREKSFIPLTISTSDYAKVLETVRCEQLGFFFLENRTQGAFDSSAHTFEMNFTYKYSVRETNAMLRQTEREAMKIIAMTDEGMSDYEKLKIFHDYLVLNVESSTDDPYADSVYGALVEKKALCEGFAKAFSYLCNIAGIDNMIVTGFTDVDHMWNMVKLGGNWYHIDVGWDKPSQSLAAGYPDMVLYQYFLVSDDIIKNNRTINSMLGAPPQANSEEMNYFRHEGMYAESYSKALEIIEQSCARSIDSGEKYFMVKLDSSNLYLQTTANLIKPDESGTSDIDRIVSKLNFTGRISYIDYYKDYRIIIFVLD
ncbi:MAG: hypothetical protein K2K57_01310 [Oscillospiraceae bacterium]|nr:hypothetical protein [Oscillospiraceae bacterium]